MIFIETSLKGAFVIEPQRIEDERGFFARTWSRDEFEQNDLDTRLAQCSISFNSRKGTLRGLHYQIAPHEETKLVRCTMGAIYDVIVDLRPDSPTFKQWAAMELTADNRRILYIPKGLAHGYQTLADHTELFYQMSDPYHPESASGVRWDDPAFGVVWPEPPAIISDRDQAFDLFNEK